MQAKVQQPAPGFSGQAVMPDGTFEGIYMSCHLMFISKFNFMLLDDLV